jgi:aspartyl/glutamyl-tRNA(Asn/Gln) amidotransferase C subunit
MLTKKEVENLVELSRIRLTEREKERALQDLEKILSYVAELKEVPTDGIPPMAGGTALTNGTRADGGTRLDADAARDAFPEKKDGFLKVPPVFE